MSDGGSVLDLFGEDSLEEEVVQGTPSRRRRGPNNPVPQAGQRFNHWVLLPGTSTRPKARTWQCDCGKIEIHRGTFIIGGGRRSCGCLSGRQDLTGIRINHLIVITEDHQRKGNAILCLCRCDCGTECVVPRTNLVAGKKAVSCGCQPLFALHLTGTKFGDWTTLEPVTKKKGSRKYKQTRCQCVCGKIRVVRTQTLMDGSATNCGCRAKIIPDKGAAWNVLWKSYLRSAKKRGIPFDILRGDFNALLTGDCAYCGGKPSNNTWAQGKWGGAVTYNGLDRKDSRLEYSIANTVTCCRRCNSMKRNLPLGVFLDWANRLAQHNAQPHVNPGMLTVAQAKVIEREYSHSARRRGMAFEITTQDIAGLCGSDCHYCGTPPASDKQTRQTQIPFKANGIDRADNATGYLLPNCKTACQICNYAKSNLSPTDFLAHACQIAAHQIAQPVPVGTGATQPVGSGLFNPRKATE